MVRQQSPNSHGERQPDKRHRPREIVAQPDRLVVHQALEAGARILDGFRHRIQVPAAHGNRVPEQARHAAEGLCARPGPTCLQPGGSAEDILRRRIVIYPQLNPARVGISTSSLSTTPLVSPPRWPDHHAASIPSIDPDTEDMTMKADRIGGNPREWRSSIGAPRQHSGPRAGRRIRARCVPHIWQPHGPAADRRGSYLLEPWIGGLDHYDEAGIPKAVARKYFSWTRVGRHTARLHPGRAAADLTLLVVRPGAYVGVDIVLDRDAVPGQGQASDDCVLVAAPAADEEAQCRPAVAPAVRLVSITPPGPDQPDCASTDLTPRSHRQSRQPSDMRGVFPPVHVATDQGQFG